MELKIDLDTSAVERKLNRIDKGIRSKVSQDALVAAGEVFVAHAIINARGKLRQLTGNLFNSIQVYDPTPTQCEVGSRGVIYAAIHEFGGTIKKKRARALFWEGEDGKLRQAQEVTIPERAYLRPAFDENKTEALNAMAHVIKEVLE